MDISIEMLMSFVLILVINFLPVNEINFAVKFMSNSAYRTAICKAKRGGFKDTLADDLLAHVLKV